MADGATLDVGAPQSGGSLISNPRILLLGGGVLLVVVIFLVTRRSGGSGGGSTDELAPSNVGVALGSLESRLKETSGRLEQQIAQQGADIGQFSDATGTSLASLYNAAASAARESQAGNVQEMMHFLASRGELTPELTKIFNDQIAAIAGQWNGNILQSEDSFLREDASPP